MFNNKKVLQFLDKTSTGIKMICITPKECINKKEDQAFFNNKRSISRKEVQRSIENSLPRDHNYQPLKSLH